MGRLTTAKSELDELKSENEKLKNDIEYAQTDEYLEKAALEELNMTKPGYTILVLDETKPKFGENAQIDTQKLAEKPNWKLWMDEFNL